MPSRSPGFFPALLAGFQKKPVLFFSCTILLSLLMHWTVFDRDLVGVHVWRQTQTQINIENFAFTDFNILHPRSYSLHNVDFSSRYEFPLMQWIFACFYKIFGDHVIISRILSFLVGVFSLTGIYKLLQTLFNKPLLVLTGTWAFCFSPVFYYYMVNPLPDNFALCMGIWSLYYFFSFVQHERFGKMILAFLFLALATLCKLPFILYGFPWLTWFLLNLKKRTITAISRGLLLLFFLVPAACWYITVIPGWVGNGIVSGVTGTENMGAATLLNILQGNLISTLPELLLNYGSVIFFITGLIAVFRFKLYRSQKGIYLSSLGLLLIAYFLFEMNMIGTVHDYYLFPFLPLLFILVAYGCNSLLQMQSKFVKGFAVFCLFALPLLAFLRIGERWNTAEPGFNKDLLKFKSALRRAVPDSAYCISGNDKSAHIWPYYLHKKCWSFSEDAISQEMFNIYCSEGARYLYSDSRKLEEIPFIKARLKRMVLEEGSIRVFELSN